MYSYMALLVIEIKLVLSKLYSIHSYKKLAANFIVQIKLIYSSIWREIKYRIKLLFISSLICNEETLYLLKLQRCKKIEDVRYNFEKRKLLQYIMVTHQ